MPRALWKGAISFGLIYVPVELHTASKDNTLPLHMLTAATLPPLGISVSTRKPGRKLTGLTSSRAMARGELEKIGRRGRTKSAAEIGQGAKARLKVDTGDFA